MYKTCTPEDEEVNPLEVHMVLGNKCSIDDVDGNVCVRTPGIDGWRRSLKYATLEADEKQGFMNVNDAMLHDF